MPDHGRLTCLISSSGSGSASGRSPGSASTETTCRKKASACSISSGRPRRHVIEPLRARAHGDLGRATRKLAGCVGRHVPLQWSRPRQKYQAARWHQGPGEVVTELNLPYQRAGRNRIGRVGRGSRAAQSARAPRLAVRCRGAAAAGRAGPDGRPRRHFQDRETRRIAGL